MGAGGATKKVLAKVVPEVRIAGKEVPGFMGVPGLIAQRERRSQQLGQEREAENQQRAYEMEAERASRAEATALEAEESLRQQQEAKRKRTTFAGANQRENIFRRTLGGSFGGRQTLG